MDMILCRLKDLKIDSKNTGLKQIKKKDVYSKHYNLPYNEKYYKIPYFRFIFTVCFEFECIKQFFYRTGIISDRK